MAVLNTHFSPWLLQDLTFALPLVIVLILVFIIFVVIVYVMYRAKRGYFCCLRPVSNCKLSWAERRMKSSFRDSTRCLHIKPNLAMWCISQILVIIRLMVYTGSVPTVPMHQFSFIASPTAYCVCVYVCYSSASCMQASQNCSHKKINFFRFGNRFTHFLRRLEETSKGRSRSRSRRGRSMLTHQPCPLVTKRDRCRRQT